MCVWCVCVCARARAGVRACVRACVEICVIILIIIDSSRAFIYVLLIKSYLIASIAL